MSDPVNEDELASLIARATGEEAGGKRPHTRGLIRSALLELEQHRERIAAHAAAHPERLGDDLVNAMAGVSFVPGIGPVTPQESAMALEIQQRRAEDLTPEEAEALRSMIRDARKDGALICGAERIGILCHVLRAHGATP